MKKTATAALTGIITGLANGLFGAGGGTILVPAMQKFLGVETHKSHATAIAVILPLSVLSAFLYLRSGEVDVMTALYISAGGIVGGFIGAKCLNRISSKGLHKIFGLFMIVAAARMIWGNSGEANQPIINPGGCWVVIYIILGALSGIISGLGIGGGTVLIPALVILFGMAQREAQNINLIYFIPTALIALRVHIKNKNVEKKLALKLIMFGATAAAVGSLLAVNMDSSILRKAFGFFLLVMGGLEFFKKSNDEKNPHRSDLMEQTDFTQIRSKFAESDVDGKINMYVSTQGLTKDQYLELLKMFPISDLPRLEAAIRV